MRNGLKLAIVTLPMALLGAAFLVFTIATKAPPTHTELAERATPVRVVSAKIIKTIPQITGFGLIVPSKTFEAIAQVSGTAEYVNPGLKKGGILLAGTVLLRLSPAEFNLAIAQAKANIRAAEARLVELTVAKDNQSAALVIEQEAFGLKTNDLERAKSLFAGGAIPRTTYDNALAAQLVQRQKVLSIESSLALLPTQRTVQIEQIAVYQATLNTAKLNLDRTELTLPFAARVASVNVENGQYIRSGTTTALFDGVAAAEVEAQVSVAELRKLLRLARSENTPLTFDPASMTEIMRGLGLTATVQLELGGEVVKWTGQVDRISDSIDLKTGTLGVIVIVKDAYSGARPGNRPPLTKGMFVKVTLSAPPVNGIVLPRNSVRANQVLVADLDNRLAVVGVKLRLTQNELVVLETGLPLGSRVVVSALNPAITGMLLEVTEDTELSDRIAATEQSK